MHLKVFLGDKSQKKTMRFKIGEKNVGKKIMIFCEICKFRLVLTLGNYG